MPEPYLHLIQYPVLLDFNLFGGSVVGAPRLIPFLSQCCVLLRHFTPTPLISCKPITKHLFSHCPSFIDALNSTRNSLNTTRRVYFNVIVKMWFKLPIYHIQINVKRNAMKKILAITVACMAPILVTAQEELFIPIDELGTEEELFEKLTEHFGDEEAGILITPEVARIMEANAAGDEAALREVLADIAGTDKVMLPGDSLPHEGDYIDIEVERYSTDEVLARMRPEHVEALADHRYLLDDEGKLLLAIGDMRGVEHAAAMEFIAKMYKPEPIESMMSDEYRDFLRLSEERGWYDVPGPAMGSHLLREVEMMDADGEAQLSRTFLEFDEHNAQTVGGYSFVFPGYERMEVHPDTKFGAVLYIEKTQADGMHVHDPNLFIAGHDATVSVGKHDDGVWVTIVNAFDGRHLYRVVLEKKLEGAEREEFVRMATELIEAD